jgi:hypothetical protein
MYEATKIKRRCKGMHAETWEAGLKMMIEGLEKVLQDFPWNL